MSSSTPPVQGQIEAPNPIELFWERHRRQVLFGIGVVAVGLLINFGLEYYERRESDVLWSEVASATNLDAGYASRGSLAGLLDMSPGQLGNFDVVGMYLQNTRQELVTRIARDIAASDEARLQEALVETKGTDAEPLVLWVKAARLVKERSWDSALAVLADLEARFPKHFLCATSEHPPQYQEEVEHEGKEKDDSTAAKDAPPELVTPTPGSAVGLLRAQIEREKQFEAAHSAFYMPPDPDAKPTVVVKLSTDEEFKIRFYKDQAPKHVESFLAKVRDGWYTNQCIDQVQRKPAQGAPETWVEQMHFGLAASTSDDRSTWATARTKPSDTQIEFEDNDLSHFSGMVAAAKDPDSKSSGERVWVTANDCAAQEDGTRVIFGRVVEGLDVVQRICRDSSFVDEAMANRGQGQLQNYIRITSMEILDDEPPAKGSNGEGGGTPESGGANKTGGR